MKAEIAVKSILFNRSRNKILLLLRSSDDPTGANTWENAGGCIERGERLEEALKREIREEAGITDVAVKNIAYATAVYGENPYLIVAYICESHTEAVTLSAEHQAYVWADKDECRALLPKVIIDDFDTNKIFDLFRDGIG